LAWSSSCWASCSVPRCRGSRWPDAKAAVVDPDPARTARLLAAAQKQLPTSTAPRFLAEDDVRGRGIERRGQAIDTIVFYFMPGATDSRYRFFLNRKAEVADFAADSVD